MLLQSQFKKCFRYVIRIISVIVCCVFAASHAKAQILITEFMAKNATGGLLDEDGEFVDWIELHNAGTAGVDLAGYFLTDVATTPQKWPIPSILLAPGEYVVIFASGKDRDEGQLHTNFQITSAGEYLALADASGQIIQDFGIQYPPQTSLVSYGLLMPVGGAAAAFLTSPTPGQANDSTAILNPAPTPSVNSRTFTNPFSVTLTGNNPGTTIRYTLDGSLPLATSPIYTVPLAIQDTVRLRFRTFSGNQIDSQLAGVTYLRLATNVVPFSSNLPLVVLDNFSGGRPTTGTIAELMIFEPDSSTQRTTLHQPASNTARSHIKVRGSSTAGDPKYSMALEARNQLDQDSPMELLGMPADADWVLHAPYAYDRTLLHNSLVYRLSQDMGRYAVRTREVEVYLNTDGGPISQSDYFGVYTLMEKITRGDDRVRLDRLGREDNSLPDIAGGYLLKIDRADPGDVGITTAGGQKLYFVEPKEQEVTTAQRDWISTYLNSFWTALSNEQFRDPQAGYTAFLDVPAALDHHILNVATKNIDALRLSTYLQKNRYGKLTFGPVWDFDRCLDSLDARDDNATTWRGETGDLGTDFFRYLWWNELFRDENFWQQWIDRYQALRTTTLSDSAIIQAVDSLAAPLAEPQARNFAKWTAAPPRTSWAWEVEHLKTWFLQRLAWMDGQFIPPPLSNSPTASGGLVTPGFPLTLSLPAGVPPGAKIYYTTNGEDPRQPEVATVWDFSIVTGSSPLKALVPSINIGTAWQTTGFDDSAWLSGTLGMGYDDELTYDPFIGIQFEPPNPPMKNVRGSAYLRATFQMPAGSAKSLHRLELRIRYDDAFVAYLNGVQVAASTRVPTPLNWDSQATGSNPDSTAVIPQIFDLKPFANLLKPGANVLAIHGLNYLLTSTDFLISPELHAATAPNQISPAALEYTGPIVITTTQQIAARICLPGGAFAPYPYTGAGSGGTPVGSPWSSALRYHFYTDAVAPAMGQLVIDEFLPRPFAPTAAEIASGYSDRDMFEYVILKNASSETLDLNGIRLTGGIQFASIANGATRLPIGGRVAVAAHQAAFRLRYGSAMPVLGEYSGQLADSGDFLELRNAQGAILESCSYAGNAPVALELLHESHSVVRRTAQDPAALAQSWRNSLDPGGEFTGAAPANYSDWQWRHFPPGVSLASGPYGDPDNDGLDNLTEFAMATNPMNGNGFEMRATEFNQVPHVLYHRRRGSPAVDIQVESTSGVTPGNWITENTPPTVLPPDALGRENVLVPVETPQNGPDPSRQFYRLRINAGDP